MTVGNTVNYTCTSLLGTATFEWQDADNGDTVLEMASNVTKLVLVLDRVSQSMNGRRYRCTATIMDVIKSATVTVTTEGEQSLLPQGFLALCRMIWKGAGSRPI